MSIVGRCGFLLGLAALFLSAGSSVAVADEVAARTVAHEESGSFLISATFDVGIADEIVLSQEDDDGNRQAATVHASPTLGITPTVGFKLNDYLEVGAELVLAWMVPEDGTSRRLLISPHARARVAFPVYPKVTIDMMLAVGASFWGEADEEEDARELNEFRDSRAGWGLRIAFGGGYAFTDWLTVMGSIGYFTSQAFGEDGDGDDLTARFGTVQFSAGFRVGF